MAGYNSFTKLLMHMDDASLIDETGKTVSLFGSLTRSNTQSKFGGFSASFNGSTQYATLADSADWDFTGDYTVDFWIYFPTSVDEDSYLIGQQDHSGLSGGGWCLLTNSGNMQFDFQNSTIINVAHGMSANTWYHWAVVRSGTGVVLYKDGTSIGTATNSSSSSSTAALHIGQQPPAFSGKFFTGFMDELRIQNGEAYWTSNFTPPTSAYSSAIANTSSFFALF